MVLYQHDHPIHWSPAYIGGKVKVLTDVISTTRNNVDFQFIFRAVDMAEKIVDS